MSKEFDDIINNLRTQIWRITDVDNRYLCELYLRSACQKLLFAEKRLDNLRRKINYHKRGRKTVHREGYYEINYPQNILSIEMDFDHCVLSLRSSLEHLAQLVNAIIPLNLLPKGKLSETVNLKRVIETIATKKTLDSIPSLKELYLNLKLVAESDWFKELHDLRIESFHVKSGRLPKTELKTLNHELLDLTFLLPDGTVNSIKTEKDREILNYCKSRRTDVEKTLNQSYHSLNNYLVYILS